MKHRAVNVIHICLDAGRTICASNINPKNHERK